MHLLGAGMLAGRWSADGGGVRCFHGVGNGILTIAKGKLLLVLFGQVGYGHRQGVLLLPARFAQAFSPRWLFGLCLDRLRTSAFFVSAGLAFTVSFALQALTLPGRVVRQSDREGV
jgi:hypothetical protein